MPHLEQRPVVVYLGERGAGEGDAILDAVQSQSRVIQVDSIAQALALNGATTLSPSLVVISTPRPGCLDGGEVSQLRKAWPLAGVVVIADSWCEGETRTGRLPRGLVRLYRHQAGPWLQRELTRLRQGKCPAWAAKGMWSSDDYWLQSAARSTTRSWSLAVCSPSPRWGGTLCDLLTAAGHRVFEVDIVEVENSRRVDAVIWDAPTIGESFGEVSTELTRLASVLHGVPIVALADFPRQQDIEIWRQLGASDVIGKPAPLDVLEQSLAAAIERTRTRIAA